MKTFIKKRGSLCFQNWWPASEHH